MPWLPPVHGRPEQRARRSAYELEAASNPIVARIRAFRSSAAWQRTRAAHMRQAPLCVDCRALGFVTAATQVDHVVPLVVDFERRLDIANLESVCTSHHAKRSAAERTGRSKGRAR